MDRLEEAGFATRVQDAANRRALDGLLLADVSTAQELLGLAQPL